MGYLYSCVVKSHAIWIQQLHANNQVILHHFQHTSRRLGIVCKITWKLSRYVEWCLEELDKICLKRWMLLFALWSSLDGQMVMLLIRGIDGASILPMAFETLLRLIRWPKLHFEIVFMVTEAWVSRSSRLGCRLLVGWEILWNVWSY
jgi:hypothetical protein